MENGSDKTKLKNDSPFLFNSPWGTYGINALVLLTAARSAIFSALVQGVHLFLEKFKTAEGGLILDVPLLVREKIPSVPHGINVALFRLTSIDFFLT